VAMVLSEMLASARLVDGARAALRNAGMQRIEHYEISAYGTSIALAQALGEEEVAALLTETLEEEKQTDLKLTEVTQMSIMPEALVGEEEGDDEPSGTSRGASGGGRRKKAA